MLPSAGGYLPWRESRWGQEMQRKVRFSKKADTGLITRLLTGPSPVCISASVTMRPPTSARRVCQCRRTYLGASRIPSPRMKRGGEA